MIVVFSPHTIESMEDSLQKFALEKNKAFVIRPELLCKNVVRVEAHLREPINSIPEPSDLPIPPECATILDVDSAFVCLRDGITNFRDFILNFTCETLTVYSDLANILNVWNRLGFKILSSRKVSMNVFRIVLQLKQGVQGKRIDLHSSYQ